MKFKFSSIALISLLTLGTAAFAQDGRSPETPKAERDHKRGFGGHQRGGMHKGMLSGLNLTEAQQQQARAIFENQKNSTQALREELRKIHSQKRSGAELTAEQQTRLQTLRSQLEGANQKMHSDLSAILTAEQRAQFDQKRNEMRSRFGNGEGRGGRHGGFRGEGLKHGGFGKGERRGGMERGFRGLNLTEAQRQQARTIFENQANSTKALREELKQIQSQRRGGEALTQEQQNRARELRSQLQESMKRAQEQLQTILTPEQRQQIQQHREQRQQRRQELLQRKQAGEVTQN